MKKLILGVCLTLLLISCLGSEESVEEISTDGTIESTIEKPVEDEGNAEVEKEKIDETVETPLEEDEKTEVIIEKQVNEPSEVEVKVEEKAEIENKDSPVVSEVKLDHEETTPIPEELTEELTDDIIDDIDAILNEI